MAGLSLGKAASESAHPEPTRVQEVPRRIEKGKLRAPEKVGAAAARVLGKHHGDRYYSWKYEDGRFRCFEHPVNLPREMAYEGKYVIQTGEKSLTPVDAVRVYKELSEVERAFSRMKALKTARLDVSSRESWQLLRSVRVVDIDLGNGQTKRSVTRGSKRVEQILRAIPIVDLDPPTPANEGRKPL